VKLGKVVGSVWGGMEVPALDQQKLVQVQLVKFEPGPGHLTVTADGEVVPLCAGTVVAMDQLGTGIGEYVLVAHGSRVRNLTVGAALPVKDVVVAIVDAADVDGTLFPGQGGGQ
jgi:ethanolamine utilization protein EutN